jgi:hypothetical protein
MGLDMYAYAASRKGQYNDYWNSVEWDTETQNYTNDKVSKTIEVAYWRKHPNLHGWFEQLWQSKGRPGIDEESAENDPMFNGIELELTWADIDMLENDIREGALPGTSGFFFGDPADDYYREADLKFIKEARAQLFLGLKVFYNSSW